GNDIEYIPGDWSLPSRVVPTGKLSKDVAGALAGTILGKNLGRDSLLAECASIRHSITYRRISARVYRIQLPQPRIQRESLREYDWHEDVDSVLTSSIYRKALRSARKEVRSAQHVQRVMKFSAE